MSGRTCVLLAGILLAAFACDSPDNISQNRKPAPPVIAGPDEVFVGASSEFGVTVFDADGDRMRAFVAWGDGDTSDYGEFVYPDQTVYFYHTYDRVDTFMISARCHDMEPLFSDWSTPLPVIAVVVPAVPAKPEVRSTKLE